MFSLMLSLGPSQLESSLLLAIWLEVSQTDKTKRTSRGPHDWMADGTANQIKVQTANRGTGQTDKQTRLWTNLLPLKLHHSTGSVHTSGEGGCRVVLVVHGHREGHGHLLFVGTGAHAALGLQHILLLKLPVQGPAGAHLQGVWVAAEGQTLLCHQAEGNPA